MAQWLRSRDGDACPMDGRPIRPAGTKYIPRASPCCKADGTDCEHLSQAFPGYSNATVQCRYKRPEAP